jgi:CubicO group peptidase (beta-lactamase class C family)
MTNVLKRIALLAAVANLATAVPATAQDAAGDWLGILEVAPGTRLPLVVHFKHDDAGAMSGTIDSPVQGVNGLPLAEILASDGRLAFTVPAISGHYEGSWDETSSTWKGEYRQAGMTWPLEFRTSPRPQPLPADWQLPSNEAIRALIDARNAPRAGQGIVVGVIGPDGQRVVSGGSGAGATVDGNTLFEIGSITKVFTALILADMVNKGEVSLDDPAEKYLPAGHHMPQRSGRQITLRDLSTHRSGLPRMADNVGDVTAPRGPFVGYGEAELLEFLDRYQLTRDIGSEWEYSNVGVGLLGYLLTRAARTDYETLLRQRITGPLSMNDTGIDLTPPQAARLVPAFDAYMRPTPPWELGVHVGAGGIRSSAADMLKFAAAVLDPNSPIAPALRTVLSVRVPGSGPGSEQALGWVITHPGPGRDVLLHDGSTGGFRTLLGIEPAKGRAVVVLINSAVEPSAADLGLGVLLGAPVPPTPPVPAAPVAQIEVTLPLAELERVVGRYLFTGGFVIAVTLDGGILRAQNESTPRAQVNAISAEKPLVFFWKGLDAEIRFTTDGSGKVTGAELSQGNAHLTGTRIEP